MSRADDAAELPDDLRELAPAYALGALDEPDRLRFERALADSGELRAEVEAFRAAASSLAESAPPVDPPASLKADLFARLDDAPQERPGGRAAPERPASERGATDRAEDRAEVGGADRADGRAERPEPAPSASAAPVDELAARRGRRRIAVVLSAAAALLILVAGVVVGVNWPGPNGWGAQRELTALVQAPDSEQATVEVEGGGEVTLVWSAELGRSAIRAEDLPDVGGDRTYELWYIDDSGAASAGTFDVSGDETWRVLEGSFSPGLAVGVSVEPAGGSPQPTTEPIVVIPT